ncbi:glutamate synthase-related protein [Desulfobacca acetoxidans]|uniref:glutamate synthase (NADPH) n=1 Tax=Desulfobacca acetoxidans (strain ATCC 700848 / DSM 11109 / ASRB2) TaxID=880072 RepID=F2NH61_DESAR|nr:glutamate synthase-related protein [Desulfobacca acetoxidans]AEB08903.1 ferredoxin-dependent glutamate synthase [Desulfobacca acetoxidans DSM 11109]
MAEKYHIPVKAVPPRFKPIGKSTVLDWGEGCLRCSRCVKETCPYQAFRHRTFDNSSMTDTIDSLCKNCFRCVQGCPRELVTKAANPEYKLLGDPYWTKEIISVTWQQAETGRIPVSGAGYGGPFKGPGFDSIWTDMSEIVRPTRDGIHGREYISTTVDLGRKPLFLSFNDRGEMTMPVFPLVEIPLPIILTEPSLGVGKSQVRLIMAMAAKTLNTFAVIPAEHLNDRLRPYIRHLIPQYAPGMLNSDDPLLQEARAVELWDHPNVTTEIDRLKSRYPELLISIILPATGQGADRCQALAGAGAEIIHLNADNHAQGYHDAQEKHLKDLTRQVHLRLVEAVLRDAVTLIVSGGIAMAEHVAKAIICGADAVAIDLPLLIALECRLCSHCQEGDDCPVDLGKIHERRGTQRVVNLLGAWNNQLLEVLGAMGLREVRRLRGEVGRAMFFEDLEKEIFAPLFAKPAGSEVMDRDPN